MKSPALLHAARVVLRKELKDNLRDRRSLLSGLLMPLLGPVMFVVLFSSLASNLREDKPLRVLVRGTDNAPSLVEHLRSNGVEVLPAGADAEAQVRSAKVDVALNIHEGYAKDFSAGRPAKVEILLDSSRNGARSSVRRVQGLLNRYSGNLGALRLLARGVNPKLASPLELQEVDLSTPERTAAELLGMIPLFLLLSVFMGGMYVAIDSTAGERERGSLEPLLINPVHRGQIVLGKWGAAVLVSWLALACALLGFSLALGFVPLQDLGVRAQLGPRELIAMTVTLLPLSLLAGSLQFLLALFSRTFKEAQTWLSLMMLLPMSPATFISISPVTPTLWMMLVPTLSHSLLLTDVLRGEPQPLLWQLLAAVSSVVWAAAALGAAVWLIGREKIVFGRGAGAS